MLRFKYLLLAILPLFTLAAGCRTLPLEKKLPGGLFAEKVAAVDGGSPFAVSPDGNVAALARSGLQLVHLPSGDALPLSERKPVRLAWSPFGYSLAAIYSIDGKSSIAIYDQHGLPMVEKIVAAELTDLNWLSESELIAGGFKITTYSFGTNYRSVICRWQPGRSQPELTELRDTTLRPSTYASWQKLLARGPMLDVVRQSGQIFYLQPVDPPVFTPYYKLIIRDLTTGKEIEAGSAAFNADGGRFSADGERLLYGDGNGKLMLVNPWSEEILASMPGSGKNPAIAPEGRSWYADGTLFISGKEATELAPEGSASFSVNGSRLFIQTGDSLYRLSGLQPAAGAMFVPAVAEKVQKLRSLRVQGLISAKEYKNSLGRILVP